ncbi:hypothetical protein SS50377_27672 [Spironucleus salmonicida]|uniref:Uncharacterized protein n=1 Tax=Spironucleus salmonicida TaxID=348837 RepID=V6LPE7_9EUKA|nr:hypothetical protein SS50377_27672 [Spironucleus salmonicida]|eukprot:EST46552.1 Hypothetical protein SS50377_13356 [Spironucleus salmonicida]
MTLYKCIKVTDSDVTSFEKHRENMLIGSETGELVHIHLPNYDIIQKVQLKGEIIQIKFIKNQQAIIITDMNLMYLINFQLEILNILSVVQPQKVIVHDSTIILLQYNFGVSFYQIDNSIIQQTNDIQGKYTDVVIDKLSNILFLIGNNLIIYDMQHLKIIVKDKTFQGTMVYYQNYVLLIAQDSILIKVILNKNFTIKQNSVQELSNIIYGFRKLDYLYIESDSLIQLTENLDVKNSFPGSLPIVNTIIFPQPTQFGLIPLICISMNNNSCIIIDFHNQKQLLQFTPLCGDDLQLQEQLTVATEEDKISLIKNYDQQLFQDKYPLLQFIDGFIFATGNTYIQLFQVQFEKPVEELSIIKEEDSK